MLKYFTYSPVRRRCRPARIRRPISGIHYVLPAIMKQHFSIEDFLHFGERYGIDYHFPRHAVCRERSKDQHIVIQGNVEEVRLPSGMYLTNSDIRILRPYESTSLQCSPLYMLVVLEGRVAVRLNQRQLTVSTGMALITRLAEPMMLHASHQADNRLKTLSLGVKPADCQPGSMIASLLHAWDEGDIPTAVTPLPEHLLTGLRLALENTTTGLPRRLLLEGVMLQVLGCGLMAGDDAPARHFPLGPGERGRLEDIRQRLERQPEKEYSLCELAHSAAMSPTSLTVKFRQLYGISVFDFLRDCRLALAHRCLQQGYSVQQSAWMSGYQHASNFATAFRRRYGVAPSAVRASA